MFPPHPVNVTSVRHTHTYTLDLDPYLAPSDLCYNWEVANKLVGSTDKAVKLGRSKPHVVVTDLLARTGLVKLAV